MYCICGILVGEILASIYLKDIGLTLYGLGLLVFFLVIFRAKVELPPSRDYSRRTPETPQRRGLITRSSNPPELPESFMELFI